MGSTYIKMMRRGVKNTFARFMSILAIVALGTGFLGGLLATTPDMHLTVDDYYDRHSLFDIYVNGTLGLTDSDVEALKALDAVDRAMPADVTDVIMDTSNGSYVTRVYGVDFSTYGTEEFLNDFELFEGRLPMDADECIVVVPNEYSEHHSLGEKLTISPENTDYESRSDTYAYDSMEIVGLIRHPQYMSINSEPTTVGTGELNIIAYVPIEFYSLEVYTDIYITVGGAEELDTFSDSYIDRIDEVTAALEDFGVERSEIRTNEIVDEANAELNDARAEYAEAEAEANSELEDARLEIEDAREQLDEARREIEDGRAEIASARAEIADNRQSLEDAKRIYYSGASQLDDAKTELAEQEQALNDAKSELEENWALIESQKAEIASGRAELEQLSYAIQAARESIAELDTAIAGVRQELEQAEADETTDPAIIEGLQEQLAGLEEQKQSAEMLLSGYETTYNENDAILTAAEGHIAAAEQELAAGESRIAESEALLEEGKAEIAANEQALADSWTQITAGEDQIASAEAQLASAETELDAGEAEIAENETKLADAEREYEEGKLTAEQELSDAQEKIDDAQREIDDIEDGEWYIFDRSDTVSFASYKSDSEKIEAIAAVFPIFFFLVAALVALTTMTRMIEEERTQIGVLKALGYSNGAIKAYYLGYSISASLIGGVIGVAAGFKTLPGVISNVYTMMYTTPAAIMPFRWNYAVVIVPVAVICTTAATISACRSQLREKPSMLMQQRAPVAGKRIFLERLPFIWRRMKFTHKVTARNIFRYKKRLFMTIIGIAGCSALLVAGFGVRDSIRDIVDKQYNEIYRFNMTVYLGDDTVISEDETLSGVFNGGEYIENYAQMHYETGYAEKDGESVSAYIYVPRVNSELKEQFTLRERKSGRDVPFEEGSVVMTEKMCEVLGVSVGDTVTVRNGDGKTASVVITGISENYVQNYIFITAAQYEEIFGEEPSYNMILAVMTDEGMQQQDHVSETLLESENILLLQYASTVRTTFENTVKNIDYVVIVLILAAGLLAIIVLYNLTNINICERRRELATIKVLGFHRGEVAAYIYRETTILSIMGMFAGFLLGVWLHQFVIRCAEVSDAMFGRTLHWTSFLYAGLVTIVFTVVVDLLMYRKLAKIDMVESMKANE